MDNIERDYIWVISKKVGPTFFKLMANRLDNVRFCTESSVVCDVAIIFSEKEFHITIFEF